MSLDCYFIITCKCIIIAYMYWSVYKDCAKTSYY